VTSIFRQSTFKLAGNSKLRLAAILIFVGISNHCPAEVKTLNEKKEINWIEFESQMKVSLEKDKKEGLSYMISGTLGLIGGMLAQSSTTDPLEKGIFTMSESIGLAAIGYGANKWMLGDEQRIIYDSIRNVKSINDQQRTDILYSYFERKKERERRESYIKAMTYGVISLVNIYSATQTTNESVRNGLYFIGGISALAAITYSFP